MLTSCVLIISCGKCGEKEKCAQGLLGNPEGKQQLGRNKLGRWMILKERNGMRRHGLDSSGLRRGTNGMLL